MLGDGGSLVKYSTPVLVSIASKGPSKKDKKEEELHHTQDILSQILPPKQRETNNGQLWIQTVLSTPATKIEVIQLQQELNKKLNQKQARQIGLCPIREQLYNQCFDEIIRQITIDCRQRGLLLVKVRNEYKNQIKAYKNLYESSINFGMRKVITSDQKKQNILNDINKLEKECNELEKQVQGLTEQIKVTKESEEKYLKEQTRKHKEIMAGIMENNQKLKKDIQKALQKG